MKRSISVIIFLSLAAVAAYTAADKYRMKHSATGKEIVIPGRDGANALLVSGWKTTPAGRQLPTGDMMLSGAVSPDGKLFAFTNTGYTRHQLHIVDLATEKEIATFPMEQAWSGLAWAPDNKRIFVSAGAQYSGGDIYVFDRWDNDTFREGRGGARLRGADRNKTAISSLQVSLDGKYLMAINNSDDHLYILETVGGRAISRTKLGDHPLASRLSKDGKTLYVTNLGDPSVSIVDVSNVDAPSVTATIPTEAHPNDLVVAADGRIFVSCGNTNNIVVLDAKSKERIETINTALAPKAPAGSTPNSVALSADGKDLFVANADNNNVAVIDIAERGKSKVEGFIPTGWYTTFVTMTPDGKRLLIGSGKGTGTGPNKVKRPIDPVLAPASFQHHGNILNGLLSFVDSPNKTQLANYTKQVYENSMYKDWQNEKSESTGTVIPTKVGEGSPIKHVLYIMKENRTYDQVFGDLKQGNGDPSLTLFGRDVTPNHHALAEQFVLLDNLYCSGEVSQDGQPWTLSAYATEFTQRAWTLSYSRHGGVDTSGGIQEQSTPYIWEAAIKSGLTARTYGIRGRRGSDAIASENFNKRLPTESATGRQRDYNRADNWIAEFKELEKQGKVPNMMMMSLGEDHTSGTAPGAHTPRASVASNDQAIGKMVEAITKSSLWSKFAIFIIEDDAQNGPDHVDSHRTVGLVISPYTKRKFVDSTMYSTVSMNRTIELLLGMPPATQHDASATPMTNSFMAKPDLSGYTNIPPKIDLMSMNPPHGYGAMESAKMDFSDYDRTDEQALNRILWGSIKGANVPMPAPVRRALPTPRGLLVFKDVD